MKENVVFTICAKNYIGLAQILEQSVLASNVDTDFLVFVADEILDADILASLPTNVIIARSVLNLTSDTWDDLSFKYNLTEFCTSIKPAVFLYLLENSGYNKIIYLDPDIYVFSELKPIYDALNVQSIVLTPHMSLISEHYTGELPDTDFLGNGIFNLGFCGLRNDLVSTKMCKWWHSKLLNNCFIDPYLNTFTDQKWMDYLPAFFTSEELCVSRHLGLNIAPWNFFERKIISVDGKLMVQWRDDSTGNKIYPVVFVHYSGYNYTELKEGRVIQNNVSSLHDYEDIKLLTDNYANCIQKNREVFDRFIHLDYTYNSYKNGTKITSLHRRIYRSLMNKGEKILNPFECTDQSFFVRLKKAGMVGNTKVNLDKVDKSNLRGVKTKLKLFNRLTKLMYLLIGFERYSLFIKLLRPFSRYESQIHLIDKRYEQDNI